jgi:hypothetical protein
MPQVKHFDNLLCFRYFLINVFSLPENIKYVKISCFFLYCHLFPYSICKVHLDRLSCISYSWTDLPKSRIPTIVIQ